MSYEELRNAPVIQWPMESPAQSIRLTTNSDASPNEESNHVPRRWEAALHKVRSRQLLTSVSEDLRIFGTSHDFANSDEVYKPSIDHVIQDKRDKHEWFRRLSTSDPLLLARMRKLIHPQGRFRQVWNPLLVLALTYTATLMPYRLAFAEDELTNGWSVVDYLVDALFAVDIVVNFWSMRLQADGSLETRQRELARHYLKSWFAVDLLSCIPFSLLSLPLGSEQRSHTYNSLARLLRLPRMYKLLRIFRLVQAAKDFHGAGDCMQDCLQVNSRLFKMLRFLLYVLVSVHISACFWYITARLDEFGPETWVHRLGFAEESAGTKYLASFYWAATTVVTVGYGDVSARTQLEMMIAAGWMIVGGGFYSYTVGSLSSVLSGLDTQDSLIDQKTAAARELARETGLTQQVLRRIVDAVQYRTQRSCLVWSDRHALFSELPKELRFEVASSMYGGVLKDSSLLRNQQKAFITFAVPLLTPVRIGEQTLLYHHGEYADEVYFVTAGWAEFLLMPQQVAFRTYVKGSYFGEVEVLFSLPRLHSCLCGTHSQLFVLTKLDFLRLLEEFPTEKKQLLRVASERRRRDQQTADELCQLLTYRQLHGSLSTLAGKPQLQPTQPLPASPEAQFAALKVHSAQLRPLAHTLLSEVESVRELLSLP